MFAYFSLSLICSSISIVCSWTVRSLIWDIFSNVSIFKCSNFTLQTGITAKNVSIFFHFWSFWVFFNVLYDFLLFRLMLFNFQILGNLDIFLLIFNSISLWYDITYLIHFNICKEFFYRPANGQYCWICLWKEYIFCSYLLGCSRY